MLRDRETWYGEDRVLAAQLGLELNPRFIAWEWVKVGTVDVEDNVVDIEVMSTPAQFFRFTLHINRVDLVQIIVLSTGSGSLRKYWTQIMPFVQGWIVVDSLTQVVHPPEAVQ